MHHCLHISEIIRHIADELSSSSSRRTLLSFALTCHAICEPALDVLWRDESASRLVLLFPKEMFEERRVNCTLQWAMSSAPSDAAWARFERYARRIYTTKITLWPSTKLCPSVDWESVLRYYPGPGLWLLPNLQHIAISVNCESRHNTRLLVTPKVRSVDVDCSGQDDMILVLSALKPCANSLLVLRLQPHHFSPIPCMFSITHIAAVSREICYLEALTKVVVTAINLQALRHLALLPSLITLSTCIRFLPGEQSQPSDHYPFLSLTSANLVVHWTQVSELNEFLSRMLAPVLDDITITYYAPETFTASEVEALPTKTHFDRLCAALTTFTSLTHLNIHEHTQETYPVCMWRKAYADSSNTPGLCALRNLTFLSMACISYALSPSDLEKMALAWPHLESLSLGTDVDRYDGNGPFAEDLIPFAQYCPFLKSLALPIEIRRGFKFPPLTNSIPMNFSLETLDVGAYISEDFSGDAAAVLGALFPFATLEGDTQDHFEEEHISSMNSAMQDVAQLLLSGRCVLGSGKQDDAR